MKNGLFKLCSMILVIVLLINMLPLQVMAEQLNTGKVEQNQDQLQQVLPEEDVSADRIVGEISQKRTEFSKEFLLENGLHMATVYPEAVHYETAEGWQEIDNRLITRADGTITNTAGIWDVSFPQQLSKDKGITVKKDGYTLSFFMAGELTVGSNSSVMAASLTTEAAAESLTVTNMQQTAAQIWQPDLEELQASVKYEQAVPEKAYSRIAYENAYKNTDVIYDLESNRVKESIVLESYNSALRGYRYTLDVGNMRPVLETDGQITLYDVEGKNVVMIMPAPYMVDDAGEYCEDVQVQLTGSGSRYTMTYLLPRQWLAAKDRAWPVILDPAVQPPLTTINIRDRSVTENWNPSQTWGYNACGYFNPEGIVRSYLKYQNLPHLTSSDIIVNATIQMYKDSGTDSAMAIHVHKVFNTWESETITWANKPGYDTTIEDYAIVQANQWYTWDVTDIARGWYEGTNTGMMFKAHDDVENARTPIYKQFFSSDHNQDGMPILTIIFRNNNGLESYWDYTSATAGRAGTGHVNNYTGNLVWVRDDIGFGGNRMPVSISHIYNANDAYTINDNNNSNDTAGNSFGMGNGWRTNYNQLVYAWVTDSAQTNEPYYVWEDADGTDHYFIPDSDGIYKDEDGLELTLTFDGSQKTITDKYGNTSVFDAQGRLVKLQNNQETPSCVEIAYVGTTRQIDTITDGVGRKYHFNYSSGLLTKISYKGSIDEEITYVNFGYSGNNLESVTDKDGETCEYTYGANNLLVSATDVDGYTLTYTYNITAEAIAEGKPARVSSVEETHNEQDGRLLEFYYSHNETTIYDYSNENYTNDNEPAYTKQTMQFNNMGNTVCIQDDQGRAQYMQFDKNGTKEEEEEEEETGPKKSNQLNLSSQMQNTVGNGILDPSFENNAVWDTAGTGSSVSIVSTEAYLGNNSLQVVTTTTGSGADEQFYYVDPDQTVTLSAYVKTGSASAYISIYDWSAQWRSEILSPNSDWTRLQVSYTNTTEQTIRICPHVLTPTVGTLWVDCVQLEVSSTASRFNLLKDGDFQNSGYGWVFDNAYVYEIDELDEIETAAPQLDKTVIQINGKPSEQCRLSQTVSISGKEDDCFVFSGWAIGDSAPLNEMYSKGNTPSFGLQVNFHYTDGSLSEDFTVNFNPACNEWQYAAGAAIAEQDYSAVTIKALYDYNINKAYFDGLQLYREEFGTSYTYDDNGNIVSAEDYANQKTQYYYSNNNLAKLISPTGTGYEYVYDEYNNVVLSRSSEGQQYEITYDTYGNPVDTKLTGSIYSASITENNIYYIRNRLTGKYMDLSGESVIQRYFSGEQTQQWQVVRNRDGSLSLVNQSNTSAGYFTTPGGESANGTPAHVYPPYYENVTEYFREYVLKAQGLRIQPATKYSYKILTKSGDYATCVSVSGNSPDEGAAMVLWQYDESEAQQWYFEPVQNYRRSLDNGSVYQFRAFHSGRYVSVNNESTAIGAPLEQYHQEGLASQKFRVNRYGNTGYYTITPQNAQNRLLQISSGVNSIGYRFLQLGDNTVSDDKLFTFEYNQAMRGFLIIPKADETLALDVAHFYRTDGAELIFTEKIENVNRIFIAEKISDTLVSSAVYTPGGNYLAGTEDAQGETTTYGHNEQTGVLEYVMYPESTPIEYTYDSMYRPSSVLWSTGWGVDLSAEYTYSNDLLTKLETATTVYNFSYGNFALPTAVRVGNDTLATYSYTNDRKHYLSALDYGNDNRVEYNYDNEGRVIQETYRVNVDDANPDTITYTYDNSGRLARTTDSDSGVTTTYYYDLIGRLVQTTKTGGDLSGEVTVTYNAQGNVTDIKQTVAGTERNINYAYDDSDRPLHSSEGDVSTDIEYDALGRITAQWTESNSYGYLSQYYTYQTSSGKTSWQVKSIQTVLMGYYETSYGYSYTYDANGNITSIFDGVHTTSYVYDAVNQLIRENNQAGGFTYIWTYDDGGNIVSRKEYAYTTEELIEAEPTDVVTYTYGDTNWGDLLTAYDGQTITHDEIGNPLSDGTWTYTWEHGRELAAMSNGNTTWTYTYDADGLRTKRTNGTTSYTYFYYGDKLWQYTIGDQVFYVSYDTQGKPCMLKTNEETYYYVTNLQGDVIDIWDNMGDIVVSYTYDAWGNLLSITGPMASTLGVQNLLRYRGYVYDSETGLYYLNSRYYNPEIGRFLNADALVSTGQGLLGNNMFAYCGNNPVNRADPNGQLWGVVIGVVLVVGLAASLSGCSAKSEFKSEPYKSADDAARAFSEQVYSSSSYIRHEYATEIYSRTINGKTTYNYNPPRAGNPHSASFGYSTPEGTTAVAYAHTHPNSNAFSNGDIYAAKTLEIDAYMVGPNLQLQRYSLSSASITNLGIISPIALTDWQRSSLVTEFQVSWDAHIAAGCDFNCGSMIWPTP